MAATQSDYALFLPSISMIYAKIVSMVQYNMRDTMPEGLPQGLKDLNFLDPANSLFYYPVSLYSAGHAILDPQESWVQESMVQQRDRANTILLGDSGGFQDRECQGGRLAKDLHALRIGRRSQVREPADQNGDGHQGLLRIGRTMVDHNGGSGHGHLPPMVYGNSVGEAKARTDCCGSSGVQADSASGKGLGEPLGRHT